MERQVLTRDEAVGLLRPQIGKDLRKLAAAYGITVFKGARLNKGWAGQTLERAIGFSLNSRQAPDGQTWELKVVPLVERHGKMFPKETMAITMINPSHVRDTHFEQSHLLAKLNHLVICGREFVDRSESHSTLVSVGTFDLTAREILDQVKVDYELVQTAVHERGFHALTGGMGVLVQPRTKGPGHGSASRAFYARKEFVAKILGLPE